MNKQIQIAPTLYDQIVSIAEAGLPNEVCGILTGLENRVLDVIQIRNTIASPVSYSFDHAELVHTIWKIEESGEELLAFFHSHPNSLPIPSQTDIRNHHYPGVPHLILGREDGQSWVEQAYLLDEGNVVEIPVLIKEDKP
jgi:proteasome lid subunit RPN8/RPN11